MNSTPKEDTVAVKSIVSSSLRTAQNRSNLVIGCVSVFLLIFVVVFCGFGAWGIYQQFRVRHFLPVQAEVTHSEVGVNRDGDGITFHPDIRFRYQVDGQIHDTGQYRIQRISSSGRSGKQKVVRRYPVGSIVQAWYDPDKPEAAVINNAFSFFPVIFLAVGGDVLGIIIGVWVWRIKGGSRCSMRSLPDSQADGPQEPRGHDVRLKPHERGPYASSFRENVIFCAGLNAIVWTIALGLWFLVKKMNCRGGRG